MINTALRRVRQRNFWTIREVAELIGVSHVTYLRWEHYQQTPHLTTLQLLCRAFHARPKDLGFGGDNDINQTHQQISQPS